MNTKYVYIKSPLKAAELLNKGFHYMLSNTGSGGVFIFQLTDELNEELIENFTIDKEYTISENRYRLCF